MPNPASPTSSSPPMILPTRVEAKRRMNSSIWDDFRAVTLRPDPVMANSLSAQEQGIPASGSEYYTPDRGELEDERASRIPGRGGKARSDAGEATAALHGRTLPAGNAFGAAGQDRGARRNSGRRA